MASAPKTIKQSQLFPGVQPAKLYEAMLSGPKHSKMTGAHATGSTRVGGRFTAWGGYIFGRNLELDPGHRILQEWQTAEWPEGAPPSLLEWTFEAKRGGTELTLKQTRVPAAQAAAYAQGWQDFYFTPMKAWFAR